MEKDHTGLLLICITPDQTKSSALASLCHQAVIHAGELAAKELSEELKNLKERYGFKTLKKLVIGSELFDVLDEILPGGGFRTLYRLRLTPES